MTPPVAELFAAEKGCHCIAIWLFEDLNPKSKTVELQTLSAKERVRGERYRIAAKQRQFYLSRIIGRELFSRLHGVRAEAIDWPVLGPPILQVQGRPSPYSVSVAHSGPILAFAVTPRPFQIGIDIELSSTSIRPDAVGLVAFTPGERTLLSRYSGEQQVERARELWVLKEAALKSLETDPLPHPLSIEFRAGAETPGQLLATPFTHLHFLEQSDFSSAGRFRIGKFCQKTVSDHDIVGGVILQNPHEQMEQTAICLTPLNLKTDCGLTDAENFAQEGKICPESVVPLCLLTSKI